MEMDYIYLTLFIIFYQFLAFALYLQIFGIIIISVMCVSGHFCFTRLFPNSSFSVLCSENFEVIKLAGTRYDETNLDIHPLLILNMDKPKFLNGIFLCDDNNSLYKLSYRLDNSLYKLLLRK